MTEQGYDVLVVEDAMELAEWLVRTLKKLGFKARYAGNGAAAISAIQDRQPDLILLDLNLPDIPGWSVLDYVRETVPDFRSHVIIITSSDEWEDIHAGETRAVDRYMVKPVSREDLAKAVEEVLMIA